MLKKAEMAEEWERFGFYMVATEMRQDKKTVIRKEIQKIINTININSEKQAFSR
jgi:3-methyladenine DNA glycosylase AlkC